MRLKEIYLVAALLVSGVRAAEPEQKSIPVEESEKYIGAIFPPYPDSIKVSGGVLVDQPSNDLKFALETVTDGNQMLLWFAKEAFPGKKGVTKWEVIDVMKYPTTAAGESIVMQFCRKWDLVDHELIAIVRYDKDVEVFKNVKRAWRANRNSEEFEEISTKGIECVNESHGL